MSVSTEVHIANLALAALGQAEITALSDSNTRARTMNTLFEPERDGLLEDHDWNFASQRVALTIPDSDYKTITGATAADPVVITSASHGFSDGDYVLIEDVAGMTELNGNRYKVASSATNTFELYQVDGSTYTAYTSGGTARVVPAFGPTNRFALPSDFMRAIRTKEQSDNWRIEGDYIVSDDTTVYLLYMKKATTVTEFPQSFIQALAARLAWKGCFKVTGSRNMVKDMLKEYNTALSAAMFKDSQQRSRTTIGGSKWVDGRINTTSEDQPSSWADSV